jgi:CheY-like chemotaxis protein
MIRLKYGQQCELVEYSDAILVATERARDLTDKLLAFARRGKHVSTLVDMRFLVREVASMLEHSIDPRISIQVNTAETAATVLGDPTPLQSALLNLGLNARDAMPDGGVLRFVVDVVAGVEEGLEVAQAVRIRVSDTGSGMSIEHQARAFEPFFTTKPSGTGMGLAAVYGTVQAHRGTVAVESVVEGGTTFTMKLPLQEVELESPRGDAAVSPSGVDQERLPLRVLVADDELGVRDVVRSFLEILGAEVTAVEDGDQAIAAARAGTFDVVVLDMAMPKLSGEEAFAALHRLDPDLPVVLMSGYVAEGKVAKLLEQGARAFLRKPFSMEALVKAVRSAAGSN